MRSVGLCIFFCGWSALIWAQKVIDFPEVAEQSHQELVITKISQYTDSTVVNLTIENKLSSGGWFCADKNITIVLPIGEKKMELLRSRGIPTCPATHQFKVAGEKLSFTLVFGAIPSDTRMIHLTENCDNSCFSFLEVILDEKLNHDIKLYRRGELLLEKKKKKEAMDCFKKVLENVPSAPTHVYGFSYYNLIREYYLSGDQTNARAWYSKLEKSNLPDKGQFLNKLQSEGIQLK